MVFLRLLHKTSLAREMENVQISALEASMETPIAAAALMTGYLWHQTVSDAKKTTKTV